jgi:hypothetical protein
MNTQQQFRDRLKTIETTLGNPEINLRENFHARRLLEEEYKTLRNQYESKFGLYLGERR